MSKAKAGPISAERLKSFIERIERLETERAAVGSDIKDVYSEAKGVGYDVKTMRKVVSLRKMDSADRDEQEVLLDTYWHALQTVDRIEARAAAGESAREIAAAEGVSKSTAHRVSQKARAEIEAAKTGQSVVVPPIARDAKGNQLHGDADGVIIETSSHAAKASDAESPPGPLTSPDLAGAVGGAEAPAIVQDAAPRARVDGPSSTPAIDDTVPRPSSPQTANGVSRAVEPVPQGGGGTGSLSDAGIPASAGSKPDLFQRITGAFRPAAENIVAVAPNPAPRTETRDQVAAGNEGGSHDLGECDDSPKTLTKDESPAEGEKSVTPAGGGHEAVAASAPEAAGLAAPAADRESGDGFGARVRQLVADAGLKPRETAPGSGPRADDDLQIPAFLRRQ